MPQSYIKRILNSRIYDLAVETPLEQAPLISARIGNNVLLKREDLQPVFSFKIRGAYNKLLQLSQAQRDGGVIAASAGNHAQGLALAARHPARACAHVTVSECLGTQTCIPALG